jgi:hypothetical protein
MKKKTKKRELAPGEDLGIDWERWSDGRAWRLKRKRHFKDVDPGYARDDAERAAERMGKVVQTLRDPQFPTKYVWVQFADHKIAIGAPCRCGSRRLLRLHTFFARCPQCGAQLFLSEEEEADLSGHATVLQQLSEIRLDRLYHAEGKDIYRGWAMRQETPVFLIAEFRTDDEDVTPEDAYERVTRTRVVPFVQLTDLIDTDVLTQRDDAGWDLTL